jgi:hypothetical protein
MLNSIHPFFFHVRGKSIDFGESLIELGDCVPQRFEVARPEELKNQVIREFFPVLILHPDEPFHSEDIFPLFQIIETVSGYRVVMALMMETDYGPTEVFVNGFRVTPTALGLRTLDFFRLNRKSGHYGDIESIELFIDRVGANQRGEVLYELTKVRIKQHFAYSEISSYDVRCVNDSHFTGFVSLGTHAIYTNPRTCSYSYLETHRLLFGIKLRGSADTCDYGEVVRLEVRPEYEITGSIDQDIFGETELGERFANESLSFPTFCGGHREFEGQRCKARYPFQFYD